MSIERRPGEAPVKSEYIIWNSKEATSDDKDATDSTRETGSDDTKTVSEANRDAESNDNSNGVKEQNENGSTDSPPSKRSKKREKRGQNKQRPLFKPVNSAKPCTALNSPVGCTVPDRCSNLHSREDILKYMEDKPEDIASPCPVYKSLGYCPTGLSCRFGKNHIRGTFNICEHGCDKSDEASESSQAWNGSHKCLDKVASHVKNVVTKETINDLRKQRIKFTRTDQYMSILNKTKKECQADSLQYSILDEPDLKLRLEEIKPIDFSGKLYLAPLTTLGNLPFRRVCKLLGADITCGEMALAQDIIKGGFSEHALLRRHQSEDLFGVQIACPSVDQLARCAEFIGGQGLSVDFIDLNLGCPIDLVYNKGAGSALIPHPRKVIDMVNGTMFSSGLPCTVKMRTGVKMDHNLAHKLIERLKYETKVNLVTLHGRSREQRYTKLADWAYISKCAESVAPELAVFGNGDVFSFEDYYGALEKYPKVAGQMIARGALIKPWIFKEIKEMRHWDISSTERLDILKQFVGFGLECWGSDAVGVEKVRKFLLEWLSFLCRYIPVGLLERLPQRLNERPPRYRGRDPLESLMASQDCRDWVRLTEMLLGPVPHDFFFMPKHKANSFA